MRICTYNVLNYGNSANTYSVKNQWLAPIMQSINAEIIGINEISTTLPGLPDTLKAALPYPCSRGAIHNINRQTQLDVLYWKNGKFRLQKDSSICHNLRDIVAYDLYYDAPDLEIYKDTIWLKVIVAHLKASNAAEDRADRALETQAVSEYLASLNQSANYLMMGDLNLYTSTETAYQNLVNPTNVLARLNDPINRPGNWNTDPAFASIETQSTRTLALPDGGASGGLDSRFDFILVSDAMLSGTKGIQYIPNSYTAYGNDGQHLNKALTDMPLNPAASPTMIQNLYNLSDHLPVFAAFTLTPAHLIPTAIAGMGRGLNGSITVINPFNDRIQLRVDGAVTGALAFQLVSLQGSVMLRGIVDAAAPVIQTGGNLPAGMYFLQVQDAEGRMGSYKIVHL